MSAALNMVAIKDEQATLDLLNGLLNGSIDANSIDIDFSSAEWLTFRLKLDGPNYHSSLNADLMRALVEYQSTLYRVASYFSSGKLNAAAIDNESRDRLRLDFDIKGGCSEIDSGLLKAIGELVNRVTKGMGPKQRFVTILTAMLLLAGGYVVPSWVEKHYAELESEAKSSEHREDHKEDMAVVADAIKTQSDAMGKLIDSQKIIAEAIKEVPKLAEVKKQAENAADEIVRQSADADKIEFQGVAIPGHAVRVLIGKKRRTGEDVVLTGMFSVKTADTRQSKDFKCVLERLSDKTVIQATIFESLLSEGDKKIVQDALWSRKAIKLSLIARKVGAEYRTAQITKAEIVPEQTQ